MLTCMYQNDHASKQRNLSLHNRENNRKYNKYHIEPKILDLVTDNRISWEFAATSLKGIYDNWSIQRQILTKIRPNTKKMRQNTSKNAPKYDKTTDLQISRSTAAFAPLMKS
jgi:hypothetical protein